MIEEPNQRILIVDDNRAIQSDFRKILALKNNDGALNEFDAAIFGTPAVTTKTYELDYACQGQEGYELAVAAVESGRRYAVAFVDMRMPPGWDGPQTIEKIWQADPQIQVVICTAFSDHSWADIRGRFGDTDRLLILKKPFDNVEVSQLACALTQKWHLSRRADLQLDQLNSMVRDRTCELEAANRLLTDEVAERRRSESALRESEQRFRRVVESDVIGVCFWQVSGEITDANDVFLRMGGFSREDLAAGLVRWRDLPPAQFSLLDAAALEQVRRRGSCTPFEKEYARKDGSRVPILVGAAAFNATAESGVAFVLDLTERKRAEELEGERNRLREAVGAHEQVLGVVSHELRTPLAAMRAMTEFLSTEGASQTDRFHVFLKSVHAEVVRMSDMVNDLLEVARLSSGAARWNWSAMSLTEVCGNAVDSIRPLVNPQNVKLTLDASPAGLPMQGDAEAVRRLVVNLLSNAGKFTTLGSIQVVAGVISGEGGQWVRIIVADTGAGMPANTAARLGEPFALNSGIIGEQHVSGSGLGLAICRGIVSAHGGSISVASAPGIGTTVVVQMRSDLPGPAAGPVKIDIIPLERAQEAGHV